MAVSLRAQAPDWLWARSGGGTGEDYVNCIATDKAGNTYVAGSFYGPSATFGTTTLTNAGIGDIFIVKYDPAGNVLWANGVGGVADEDAMGIAVDSGGNCYITGYFYSPSLSFGQVVLNGTSPGNMYVAKYSATGGALWARTIDASNSASIGRTIAVDGSGACYVTGMVSSNGPVAFGAFSLPGNGNGDDAFVVKYDPSGTEVWARRPGGTGNDAGWGIAADRSGNCYVTGVLGSGSMDFGSGVTLANPAGATRIFTVRYNTAGNAVWARTSSVAGNERGYLAAVDSSGAGYIAGEFSAAAVGFGNVILANGGQYNVFLTKYDTSGNVVWAKQTGGNSDPEVYGLAVDATGRSYISGFFSGTGSFGSSTFTSAGSVDAYIMKFDEAGAASWAKQAGGTGLDIGNGIAIDGGGNTYVTGRFNSPSVAFGTTTLANSTSSRDVFTAKLAACTAAPPQPGTVSGSATPCIGEPATYAVAPVTGAGSYTWILPSGWTGTSTTNSITVTPGPAGGTITVVPVNTCGTGPARTFTVTSVSPAPSPMITRSGATLSTTTAFSSYQWYRNGTLISGATAQSFIAARDGSYYVAATNAAGCSGQSNTIGLSLSIEELGYKTVLSVYPNPVSAVVHVLVHAPAAGSMTLSDLAGRSLYTIAVPAGTGEQIIDTKVLPAGIYLLTYKGAGGTETVKIIRE